MRFDGYDFIMLGVVLGTGSALLFAKAYLFPSFPEEAAQVIPNGNPFQVRNAIVQHHEAVAGAIWAVGSLAALLIGTVRTIRSGQTGYLIDSWIDILVLLAVGLVAWRATTAITDVLSRRAYLPRMIEMQRGLFERDHFVIAHEGRYQDEVERGVESPREVRQRRLADASRNFEQVGKLVDMPRRPREPVMQHLERLRRFFQPAQGPTVTRNREMLERLRRIGWGSFAITLGLTFQAIAAILLVRSVLGRSAETVVEEAVGFIDYMNPFILQAFIRLRGETGLGLGCLLFGSLLQIAGTLIPPERRISLTWASVFLLASVILILASINRVTRWADREYANAALRFFLTPQQETHEDLYDYIGRSFALPRAQGEPNEAYAARLRAEAERRARQ